MGALKGSISVRRYLVTDAVPADLRKKILRGLKAHAFTPIDPKTDVDRSAGWVSILDSEDTSLDADQTLFVASGGEQLRVSLRMDVLKPSSSEVRRQLDTRVRAVEAEQGRTLAKRERRELKEEIARALRLRTLPRVRTFDVVWNLDTGRLYLWSQTKNVCETFLELFTRSFALRIVVEGPSLWARAASDAATLDRLQPTPELVLGFAGLRPLTGGIVEDEVMATKKKPKSGSSTREPTLRDEIAASGETPTEQREEALDELSFLAREFLTWLVYHADVDGGGFAGAGEIGSFHIQFGGRLTLRTTAGFVTDMTVKGSSPGISPDLRYALAGGLAVKEAELRLVLEEGAVGPDDEERAYVFALAADGFDLKRVKIPALLTEEEDDRADERLALLGELDAALQHAYGTFIELRCSPSWKRNVVPALRSWLAEGT